MQTATAGHAVSRGQLWFRALRAPFLVATFIPVGVGTLRAIETRGAFDAALFGLTLLGAACVHLATNMLNDAFDYRSGNDLAVRHQNPFAGGGRVLTKGVLSVRAHLAVALGFLAAAVLIGLYLVSIVGTTLLWIGLLGVAFAFFYVGPPLRIANRGVGELVVAASFGPLVVLGTYYVQARSLDLGAFLLSIPIGLLVGAILWINEFPDIEADVSVGKRTLVARLGVARAITGYEGILAAAYVVLAASAILAITPLLTLLPALTIPLAIKTARGLRAHGTEPMALIPSNAGTILLFLVFGVLLMVGEGLAILF